MMHIHQDVFKEPRAWSAHFNPWCVALLTLYSFNSVAFMRHVLSWDFSIFMRKALCTGREIREWRTKY